MSYRVEKNEKVSDAVRRIAAEEIHAVIGELASVPLHRKNIHQARRHLKKLRALLRFVRKQFPPASFKKENQTFRAIGKMLAPSRDARVIRNALASLKSSSGTNNPALRPLTEALQDESGQSALGQAQLGRMRRLLRRARGRIKNWPLRKFAQSQARDALERSFVRCRKAFCQCLETENSETFHQCRKRVKALEYHLALFEIAWRGKTKRTWEKIKQIDDFLGEDHDLVLVSEKLRRFKFDSAKSRKGGREIARGIGKRRAKLQRRAIKKGEDLFRMRPRIFVGRAFRETQI